MGDICLGAYATQQEADNAKALRPEPQPELEVVEDGEAEHTWRVWWHRPD